MEALAPTGRNMRRGSSPAAGFSLVEVTLAIGIVAFAFIAVVGLIPTGLKLFRQSMDLTLATQIAQRELVSAQEKDFDLVITPPGGTTPYNGTPANLTWQTGPVWYDDTGGTIVMTDPLQKPKAIYCVNIRVTPATALPKVGGGSLADNINLATVTVQVAHNPSQQDLAFNTGAATDQNSPMRNLWSGAFASKPTQPGVVPIYTFVTRLARNR